MDAARQAVVAELVARFTELRRGGRRESVDALLDGFGGLPDRAAVRTETIRRLSQQARLTGAFRGSSAKACATVPAVPGEPELPELEGYDIIDELGRGGMGAVYEAYQQSTGRRVAVKFLLPGLQATEAVRRRFEREVELVARLQHPNIVSVLDSGVHRSRYFYVMDYVEGVCLDQAVIAGRWGVRTTLDLIAAISAVVDYAHQHGVLHRDLKPSNVLVDGAGQPHILDFGLAKAIDPSSGDSRELTLSEPGQLLGTLAYMSPEQSRGQIDQISVRSDVYSLGAMAYELLAGQLPCGVGGAISDVLHRITEQSPPLPSSLRCELDADIDAMLLKALEKSPAGRYATAGEFAEDLRRYLAGDAITARRAGLGRRALRVARRHRGIAAVSGLALVIVITVTIAAFLGVTAERDRAVRAQQAALAEVARTGRVKHFLQETLGYVDPDVARSADVRFVDQLDHAAAQVAGAFGGFPVEAAEVRHTLGYYYAQRACYKQAEGELRAALAIREAHLGADSADTAATMHELAAVLHAQDCYSEAEPLYRQAMESYRRQFGDRHRLVAQAMNDLAWLLKDQGRYREAEPLYLETLALRRELLGDRHVDVAETLNDLAHVYYTMHDAAKAEPLFREALAIRLNPVDGEKSFIKIAATMASLGGVLTRLDRLDEAESLLREALAIRRRLLGDEHTRTIVSMNELGLLLREKERYQEAEELLRRTLELRKLVHGPTHSKVAVSLVNLGLVLQAQGGHAEARPLYEEALSIWRDTQRLGDHENVAAGLSHLANLLRETRDYEPAEQYCREALEMRLRLSLEEPAGLAVGGSKLLLGRILLERGDAAAAEPLLLEAVAILSQKRSPEHWMTARARAMLGACRLMQARFAEAEADLLAAFEIMKEKRPPPNRESVEVLTWLVELYETWGQPQQAAVYRAMLPPN